MSCFMVSDNSLASMADYMYSNPDFPIFEGKEKEEIYISLFEMNRDAVEGRYRGMMKCEFTPFEIVGYNKPDKYQFLGYLRCYMYQCCECDNPEKELYMFLDGYQKKEYSSLSKEEKQIIENLPWE